MFKRNKQEKDDTLHKNADKVKRAAGFVVDLREQVSEIGRASCRERV